jgi:hypothetical protein
MTPESRNSEIRGDVHRKLLGKHIPAATNTRFEVNWSVNTQQVYCRIRYFLFVQSGYKEEFSREELVEFRDASQPAGIRAWEQRN